ncbi:MAG: hypothetical protein ACR2N1_12585 [Rubripirellula sp.]
MAIRAADYVVVCAGEHETLTCIPVGEVFSAVAIFLLWDVIGWCVGAKLRSDTQQYLALLL